MQTIIAGSIQHIEEDDKILAEELGKDNLVVNLSKKEQFKIPQKKSEAVSVKKLGSKFNSTDDLKYRVQRTIEAFGTMWRVWKSKSQISQKLQFRMYDAFIKPILLYNAGANDAPVSKMKIVDAAHRRHIRHIVGIYYIIQIESVTRS
jgi:hypothetical protein